MKKILIFNLLVLITLLGLAQNNTATEQGFLKANGTTLKFQGSQEPFLIKSINLTGIVENKALQGNIEAALDQIKADGFNTIRIELTTDMASAGDNNDMSKKNMTTEVSNPADNSVLEKKYDAWISNAVLKAEQKGLFIILALRGSTSEAPIDPALSYWSDIRTQTQFLKIWQGIAAKFKANKNIIGYDLFPDPIAKIRNPQFTFVANNVIMTIRRIDPNHTLFLSGMNKFLEDWKTVESLPIKDQNIALTGKFYAPEDYSLQKSPWVVNKNGSKYPDLKIVDFPDDLVTIDTSDCDGEKMTGSKDMTFFQGKRFLITDTSIVAGLPVIEANYISDQGEVILQGITITEYDSHGNQTTDLIIIDPASTNNWQFVKSKGGTFKRLQAYTASGEDAMRISASTGNSKLFSKDLRFQPKMGYYYVMGAYMKPYLVSPDGEIKLTIYFEQSKTGLRPIPRNIEFIIKKTQPITSISTKFNLPVFINEMGLYKGAFSGSKGGDKYFSDANTTFTNAGIGYSVQSFNGSSFGIYKNKKDEFIPDNKIKTKAIEGIK
jgi:endoglucanase